MREFTGWLLILLVAGALLGAAYLTRNPEAPILEAATDWPVVGPWAERFRHAYLGPELDEARAPAESETPEAPSTEHGRRSPRATPQAAPEAVAAAAAEAMARSGRARGTRSPPRRLTEAEAAAGAERPRRDAAAGASTGDASVRMPITKIYSRVWLWPGLVLRRAADPASPVVQRVAELACVPSWESRPGWVEVSYRGSRGWVAVESPSIRRSRRERPYSGARRSKLRQALSLGEVPKAPVGRVGAFDLYTVVRDRALLELIETGGSAVEAAYGARYGLALGRLDSQPAIVLLGDRQRFQRIRTAFSASASSRAPGGEAFANGGLVVAHTELPERHGVLISVFHEMTHALNRRALAPRLPPWLEEGLATDVGLLWFEDPDAPEPGMVHARHRGFIAQAIYAMLTVVEPGGIDLEALTAADQSAFFSGRPEEKYAASVLFVRYLLDGEGGALAGRFREFLEAVSAGRPATGERLLEHLGRDWGQLEAGLEGFLDQLAAERDRLTGRG